MQLDKDVLLRQASCLAASGLRTSIAVPGSDIGMEWSLVVVVVYLDDDFLLD